MSSSTAEQLVYTWANKTFSGQGLGVVATTAGWAGTVSAQDPSLAPLLTRLRLEQGEWLVRATFDHALGPCVTGARGLGRDAYEREGRYVASVVVPHSSEDFLRALAAVVAGVGHLDWGIDLPPSRELTPLTLADPDERPDRAMLAWLFANWSLDAAIELPIDTDLATLAATVWAIPTPLYHGIVLRGTRSAGRMYQPDSRLSHAAEVLAAGARPDASVASVDELVAWAEGRTASRVPPWGDDARRVLAEFWSVGERPDPGTRDIAIGIWRENPADSAAWLGELRPSDERLWEALRLMDDPSTGAAIIAASGLPSILATLAGPSARADGSVVPPLEQDGEREFHPLAVRTRDEALPPAPEHERQGLRGRLRRGR